jgi:hypothetical protein
MAELQFVENPTVVVVPPPNRGGRYQIEFRAPAGGPACGHVAPQALLWLIFLEAGEESGREVSDVICSDCEPERYARARAWADALR